MIFLYLCAAIVITIGIIIGSMLFGMYVFWSPDPDEWTIVAWIICAIGFAFCLTYILYRSGII